MIHELKTLPCFFEATRRYDKLFECRNNRDRGFNKGDIVMLQEFNPNKGGFYTGREIQAEISYVLNYNQQPDWVVFGFKIISNNFEDK